MEILKKGEGWNIKKTCTGYGNGGGGMWFIIKS